VTIKGLDAVYYSDDSQCVGTSSTVISSRT
jgi:hypothetical protein